MKIYFWHPSAYQNRDFREEFEMKYHFSWFDFNTISFEFPSPEFRNNGVCVLEDLILVLNNIGLNVMLPKDFKEKQIIYVDTTYFRQR